MTAFTKLRQFRSSGPVSAAFIADQKSLVKMLRGPVGGGKSVACVYDSIRRPSLMPACNDGVIRYRRAIIGTTYGQLERNLYPTWKRWLPEDGGDFTPVATWNGGGGRSATHKLEWDVLRGNRLVTVKAEYVFAAIGEAAVEEFMRGFEPTDFWLYEVDQEPEAVIDVGITRLGRYPATGDAPDALRQDHDFVYQIVGDLNAPDFDSWFVRKFEVDAPPGFKVYAQPGGRSAKAENLANLPRGYYDRMVETLDKRPNGRHLIKRMVDNRYAPSLDGEPVYPEYDDDIHLLPDVGPLTDVPIRLGFDQGLQRPACVAAQIAPSGQWRILFEVVPGRMNGRRFAEHVRRKLIEVAPGVPLAEIHYCDPAGTTGVDREAGDLAWNEIVQAELGIVIQGTETNEIDPRLTAVKDELKDTIEPGVPALVVSRAHCPMLRRGFASHYRYLRQRIGGGEQTADRPEKTDESHPHDALQYLLLGTKGRYGVIEGKRDPRAPARALGHKARRSDDDGCTVLAAPVEV